MTQSRHKGQKRKPEMDADHKSETEKQPRTSRLYYIRTDLKETVEVPIAQSQNVDMGTDVSLTAAKESTQEKDNRNEATGSIKKKSRYTPVKFAALVDKDKVQTKVESGILESALRNKFDKIKGNRPVQEISKFSIHGSPLQIITPNRTVLNRTSKNGVFYIFSNHAMETKQSVVKQISEQDNFFNSPEYQAIKKPKDETKNQHLLITPDLLNVKRKRTISQHAVMRESTTTKGGATAYARATKLFPQEDFWEWLHMIAFRFKGKESQDELNLVGGTKHANTDMMFVESLVGFFSKYFPEGFVLDVKANLIPGLQIAKEIEYTIETANFILSFEFNAQSTIKPHFLYQEYINALGEVLILDKAELKPSSEVASQPQRDTSKKKLSVFFKKELLTTPTDETITPLEDSKSHLDETLQGLIKKLP